MTRKTKHNSPTPHLEDPTDFLAPAGSEFAVTSIYRVTVSSTLSSLATRWGTSVDQLVKASSIDTSIMDSRMLEIPGEQSSTFKGTDENETVTGNSLANYLQGFGGVDYLAGGGGADTLDGGAGDDFVEGGAGNDRLTGGSGSDRYVFTDADRLAPGSSGYDLITGFQGYLGEKIVLSGIDANTTISGNQTLNFIGTGAFSGKAGELRYYHSNDDTWVIADVNGDAQTDFRIRIEGIRTMYQDDFIL